MPMLMIYFVLVHFISLGFSNDTSSDDFIFGWRVAPDTLMSKIYTKFDNCIISNSLLSKNRSRGFQCPQPDSQADMKCSTFYSYRNELQLETLDIPMSMRLSPTYSMKEFRNNITRITDMLIALNQVRHVIEGKLSVIDNIA